MSVLTLPKFLRCIDNFRSLRRLRKTIPYLKAHQGHGSGTPKKISNLFKIRNRSNGRKRGVLQSVSDDCNSCAAPLGFSTRFGERGSAEFVSEPETITGRSFEVKWFQSANNYDSTEQNRLPNAIFLKRGEHDPALLSTEEQL